MKRWVIRASVGNKRFGGERKWPLGADEHDVGGSGLPTDKHTLKKALSKP
jgi:hypothetical protein